MSLKNSVIQLLDDSIRLCESSAEAEELSRILKSMRSRLDEPLRTAIVGMMKAGKSTLLNALIGAEVVYTGTLETTYTVTWFKYGNTPSLEIYFNDNTKQTADFKDMQKWTVRAYERENPRMNDVKYIIVYYPAEVLKTIEFIDTPGLNSVYGKDARNTLEFLAVNGSKEDKATIQYASEADSIIYAVNRSVSETDINILKEFQNNISNSSPINSIGVLTRVDLSGGWNVFSKETPVETAEHVTDSLLQNQSLNSLLYTIKPVTAKPVEGCPKLSDAEKALLMQYSRMDMSDLSEALSDAGSFCSSTEDIYNEFGDVKVRAALINNLSQYGILEAANQLRMGHSTDELTQILYDKCGIKSVNELLQKHFGGRTFVIKTKYIFDNIKHNIKRITNTTDSRNLKEICRFINEQINNIQINDQRMNELKVLQSYYDGRLTFYSDDERYDFMRMMGEYGYSADKRLGFDGEYTMLDLLDAANKGIEKWAAKAGDLYKPASYREASGIILRSYEKLHYHLSELIEE